MSPLYSKQVCISCPGRANGLLSFLSHQSFGKWQCQQTLEISFSLMDRLSHGFSRWQKAFLPSWQQISALATSTSVSRLSAKTCCSSSNSSGWGNARARSPIRRVHRGASTGWVTHPTIIAIIRVRSGGSPRPVTEYM
uniref:Nodulation protein D 2 n=1 Tax=Lygus hesperus TaxID=30085 RepID=A0A0A9Y386_LYGHE